MQDSERKPLSAPTNPLDATSGQQNIASQRLTRLSPATTSTASTCGDLSPPSTPSHWLLPRSPSSKSSNARHYASRTFLTCRQPSARVCHEVRSPHRRLASLPRGASASSSFHCAETTRLEPRARIRDTLLPAYSSSRRCRRPLRGGYEDASNRLGH